MAIHMELERRLAEFKKTEAVVVFQSGFAANAGTVSAVLGKDDVVVSDELNHASIIDGCRLSRATIKVFPHKDVDAARKVLQSLPGGPARRCSSPTACSAWTATSARSPTLCALAEEYGCIMMVDDAHASGVFGRNGRGTIDHFGVHGRVDIQVGTLSKAIGVLGGYVAGSRDADRLPVSPRAAVSVLDVAPAGGRRGVHRRDRRAARRAADHRSALGQHAVLQGRPRRAWASTPGSSESPITPVIVGDGALAMKLSDRLFAGGRVRAGDRVADGAAGQGARADDRDGHAHARRAAVCARRVRRASAATLGIVQ